jgi:8-oxo-dGTP diphosphatase
MPNFSVRIYALIFNEKDELLVSDENFEGHSITKFPGGGLEYGEGTIDCLRREAIEEFGQEIEILEHFYTTDFFQKALYFDETQLIAVYYKARFVETPRFEIKNSAVPVRLTEQGSQLLRWVPLSELTENQFTFPIDRYVLKLLTKDYYDSK